MKFREIDKILKKDGWYIASIKGSHYQYKHPTKKGKVTVPCHNTDFKLNTVKSIFKQAGLS